MNTLRYNSGYIKQVIDLLQGAPNLVHLPADVFFKIGKEFENKPDREKLDALLKKTYTVMAVEGDTLVGLAGIDDEGNIGIFAVQENIEAQSFLLNAIERTAAKNGIGLLFVQPFEDARKLFISAGYEPLGEGDDFNLIKEIASQDALQAKAEATDTQEPEEAPREDVPDVSRSAGTRKLSAYVPIKAAKLYYGYALAYLCGLGILLAIFLVFGFVTANYTKRPLLGEILHQLRVGLPFYIVFAALFVYTISVPLIEKRKYKKLLASPELKCTRGKIVRSNGRTSAKPRCYCRFDDGKENRRVPVPYRIAVKLIDAGRTSTLVAYDRTDAVVLVRKGVYPDKISFDYHRDDE